jgi:hypothetical protein
MKTKFFSPQKLSLAIAIVAPVIGCLSIGLPLVIIIGGSALIGLA